MAEIDELTVIPLWVTVVRQEIAIGHATAFIVDAGGTHFLFTNWHVVTGKDATTGERQVAEPDHLTVWHHVGKLGSWETATYTLHDELWDPTWIEHPLGREVDVIALPINPPETAIIYPLDLSIAEKDLAIWPSSAVSIIGFPHQIVAGGKFPIWKTAHIASDVGLDFDNKPAFLIDATTNGNPTHRRRQDW